MKCGLYFYHTIIQKILPYSKVLLKSLFHKLAQFQLAYNIEKKLTMSEEELVRKIF